MTDGEKRLFVMQTLAYAKYDVLIQNDHDNFIKFLYDVVKDEAREYQHYAEVEEHEDLTFIECMHRVLQNIRNGWLEEDAYSIRDLICLSRSDPYYPSYLMPLIYSYDPECEY